jgi:hypothetical protein
LPEQDLARLDTPIFTNIVVSIFLMALSGFLRAQPIFLIAVEFGEDLFIRESVCRAWEGLIGLS